MQKLLHHGLCTEEFKPEFIGTDYFAFFHQPCRHAEPYYGHCEVTAVLVDNDGRVIFNLKCRNCGAADALKTHPLLWLENRKKLDALKRFHLSPQLKARIKSHWWDDC